ncbi:MAG: hypothetical protein ACK58T_12190 [Phycisphaerae bacterium]
MPPLAALSEWCFRQSSPVRTTRPKPHLAAQATHPAHTVMRHQNPLL